MKIGIIYSGEFGERFVSNLVYPKSCPRFGACGIDECDYCKTYDYSKNVIFVKKLEVPEFYGNYIEDPVSVVGEITRCDVLVAINLHPDVLAEIPNIAEFNSLIVPVEDPKWLSPGLREQLRRKCEEFGIKFFSPKPFCSSDTVLSKLGFGRPEFEVEMNGNAIERVKVLKSDPCGSAYYVAKKMIGYVIEDEKAFWKEIHQHQCAYPCMASIDRDREIKEAPFHLAGYVMVYQFSKACKIDASRFIPEHMRKFVLGNFR